MKPSQTCSLVGSAAITPNVIFKMAFFLATLGILAAAKLAAIAVTKLAFMFHVPHAVGIGHAVYVGSHLLGG